MYIYELINISMLYKDMIREYETFIYLFVYEI